jgi:hypothetical protein
MDSNQRLQATTARWCAEAGLEERKKVRHPSEFRVGKPLIKFKDTISYELSRVD